MIGDLTDIDFLVLAMRGCKYVIHAAHPNDRFDPGTMPKDSDYVPEAEIQTRNILESCRKCSVIRLVVTCCMSAIIGNIFKGKNDIVYSELDFCPISDELSPYVKSKLI